MGESTPRAEMLGALRQTQNLDAEAIAALFSGEGHAPAKLTEAERERLAAADLSGAPSHVVGDFPEWLAPQLEASFGASAAEEGRALAERAPVDLRVNSLKTSRDKALRALAHLKPEPTPLSPVGLRIAMRPDGRAPPLASDPAYVKGLVELQDEGSQLAALLAEAKPGMQVLDLCAGAGGKTLALAAAMDNQGQIYAADPDAHRLAPIFAQTRPLGRAQRSGAGAEGPNGRARRPQRALRSRADRCALHRLRRLAPQSRRQMAHPPWRARTAHQGSGRDARKRAAFRQTGRAHRLHHLLRPQGRERGSDRRVHGPPRRPAPDRRECAGECGRLAGAGRASLDVRPRLSPQPASDRHRRVLHRDPSADVSAGGEIRNVRTGTPRLEIGVKSRRLVIPPQGPNAKIADMHGRLCKTGEVDVKRSLETAAVDTYACWNDALRALVQRAPRGPAFVQSSPVNVGRRATASGAAAIQAGRIARHAIPTCSGSPGDGGAVRQRL